jgi:hypothetical protein
MLSVRAKKILSFIISLGLVLSVVGSQVKAAPKADCECFTDLDQLSPIQVYKNQSKVSTAKCIAAATDKCTPGDQSGAFVKGALYPDCIRRLDNPTNSDGMGKDSEERCKNFAADWAKKRDQMIANGKKDVDSAATESSGGVSTLTGWINKCGKANMDSSCKDITIFVKLALDIINYLFAIVGGLALGVFVYGGFVLILSRGNPDKVQQGTGAMLNAVIGIVVAFSGYVLVSFLGEAIGIKSTFQLK